MKGEPVQIHWHDKQPVFAVDFDPSSETRLATCGGDGSVRIWHWELPSGQFHYAATLTRHTGSVNCVRFSPQGTFLASVGDGKRLMS